MKPHRLEFIFDTRFPSFTGEVSQALQDARVELFPDAITDEQLQAAFPLVQAQMSLTESEDAEHLAWDLFADDQDRQKAQAQLKTKLRRLGPARRVSEIVRAFLLEATNFHDQLERLAEQDDPEFDRLYAEAKARRLGERRRRDAENDRYRFFNEPEAAADFVRWLARSPWTLDEAAALSLGKSPDVVNLASLEEQAPPAKHSPFVAEFRERLAILRAAEKRGEIDDPVPPGALAKLARNVPFSLPDALVQRTPSIVAESQLETFGKTSRASLYKFIIGMAVLHYGFDVHYPKGSRSYQKIANDLEGAKVGLDADTVRLALSDAITWLTDTNRIGKLKSPQNPLRDK